MGLYNPKDMVSKGRQAKGEQHGCCFLTDKEVEKIRELYKTGLYTHKQLGRDYKVSQPQISRIISGKRRGYK